LLGEGAYGKVYRGRWRLAPVAIKQFHLSRLPERELAAFRREVSLMSQLRSPFVTTLYGYCTEPAYCLVMEFVPKGSLYHLLHSTQALSWPERYTLGIGVGSGLHYLHNQTPPMIHRDLKSPNILVDDRGQAKLADFGLAMNLLRTAIQTTSAASGVAVAGSLRWMAPELFGLRPAYSVASDSYAYGMVLWELASRATPYDGIALDEIRAAVRGGEREALPAECPPEMVLLITKLWLQAPAERLAPSAVVAQLQTAYDQALAQMPAAVAAAVVDIPAEYLCPLTLSVMEDPVVASDGHSYEKAAITQWLAQSVSANSPLTGLALTSNQLVPNITLRKAIQDWLAQHDLNRTRYPRDE